MDYQSNKTTYSTSYAVISHKNQLLDDPALIKIISHPPRKTLIGPNRIEPLGGCLQKVALKVQVADQVRFASEVNESELHRVLRAARGSESITIKNIENLDGVPLSVFSHVDLAPSLSGITRLYLKGCVLSETFFADVANPAVFPSLKSLSLPACYYKPKCLEPLRGCSGLKEIDFSGCFFHWVHSPDQKVLLRLIKSLPKNQLESCYLPEMVDDDILYY